MEEKYKIVMSKNYLFMKVNRKMLKQITEAKLITHKQTPAWDYLLILSNAVCYNVDTRHVFEKTLGNCQVYFTQSKLTKLFGCRNFKDALKKLENLKDIKALNYAVQRNRYNKVRIYIHLNVCTEKIPTGIYENKNRIALSVAFNSFWNDGFFLVNKKEFIDTFYRNIPKQEHGIQDLFLFLYEKAKFNDSSSHSVNKDISIVSWGVTADTLEEKLDITYEELAMEINVSTQHIKRCIDRLVEKKLLSAEFIRNRGHIFSFPMVTKKTWIEIKKVLKTVFKQIVLNTTKIKMKVFSKYINEQSLNCSKKTKSVRFSNLSVDVDDDIYESTFGK